MDKQTVRFRVDLSKPPVMSDKVRAELEAAALKSDDEIDTSDIPPLDEKFWQNAVRNPFYKPTKKSTTVRLDSDVLHWLKQQGRGYQSRINAILRREMLTALKQHESK